MIINDLTDTVYISMFVETYFRPKSPDDIENWCGGNGQMISVDYKGFLHRQFLLSFSTRFL